MTLDQIRTWAETTGAGNRQERRREFLVAIFFIALSAVWISRASSLQEQIAFGTVILWFLAGQAHAFFSRPWSNLPADRGRSTSVAFLRAELLRKRDHVRLIWLRVVVPTLLVLAIFLVPRLGANFRYWKNAIPFLTLLSIWMVAMLVIRVRQARKVRAELRELEALEREVGSPSSQP